MSKLTSFLAFLNSDATTKIHFSIEYFSASIDLSIEPLMQAIQLVVAVNNEFENRDL